MRLSFGFLLSIQTRCILVAILCLAISFGLLPMAALAQNQAKLLRPLPAPENSDFIRCGQRILFFDYSDLWSSDGTLQRTQKIKGFSNQGLLRASFGEKSVFMTEDSIWISDGTTSGTVFIQPFFDAFWSGGLAEYKGSLYFNAISTSGSAQAIWRLDKNNKASWVSGNYARQFYSEMNGWLYFMGDGGLCRTDGTSQGTSLVSGLYTMTALPGNFEPRPLVGGAYYDTWAIAGNRLFFNEISVYNALLWCSDGTAQGTVRLFRNAYPGKPVVLGSIEDRAICGYDDGAHGRELWLTDGTSSGTLLLKDINPGIDPSNPYSLKKTRNSIVFAAVSNAHGKEYWKTDGTSSGTLLLRDINPGTSSSLANPWISIVSDYGDLFFVADDGTHGSEIWQSDGTAGGTFIVADLNPGPGGITVYRFLATASHLFFMADVGTSKGLWSMPLPGRPTQATPEWPLYSGFYRGRQRNR